jgi:hypothetical protein
MDSTTSVLGVPATVTRGGHCGSGVRSVRAASTRGSTIAAPADETHAGASAHGASADAASAHAASADAALNTFRDLLDDLVQEDTEVSAATYRRYLRLDRLRLWSERAIVESLGGPEAVGVDPQRWNPARQAREELVYEIACALRVPFASAAALLWEAKTLVHDLPATGRALRDGEIGPRHATVMIEQVQSIPEHSCGEFEQALLPLAKDLTVSKFSSVARKKRELLHPESITERRTKELSQRRVWVTPDADGMAYLTAYLSAEIAYAAHDRLTQIADTPGRDDDDRHLGQKRADALADLLLLGDTCTATGNGELLRPPTDPALDGSAVESDPHDDSAVESDSLDGSALEWGPGMTPRTGHAIRARVLVTVPVLTLLGHTDTPGTLEGYGPIDPETARALARTAPSFTRILTHPVTSAIIDVDRTTYAVPADLRLALRIQDETCRSVTCNQPAQRCDIDHNVPYSTGGTTRISNLCHLCPSCHRRRHHTRVTVRNSADGDIHWTTPSGKTYTTHPARPLAYRRPSPPGVFTEQPPDTTVGTADFPF